MGSSGRLRWLRLVGVALVAALVAVSCTSDDSGGSADSSGTAPGGESAAVAGVPAAAQEVMDGDAYRGARWSWLVVPIEGGDPVFERNAEALSAMGSNMKLYSVGTWLDATDATSTITTPVHTVGDDLVLVAMGDIVMGARESETGTLAYSVPPQPDANGLPGAKPAPGEPLAGLDDLARQVAESGTTSVAGDVVIDDRLWEAWDTPGGPISPIVVNDNLMIVQSSPTQPGQPAQLNVIPDTEAFTIDNQVETVEAGGDTAIIIAPADPDDERALVVSGTIAADSDETMNVYHVQDPARFARVLFIEALQRAGVEVTADIAADNSTDALPEFGSYAEDTEVASISSVPIEEIATLIWKTSHNYGANVAVCLLAVEAGSTDCEVGLETVHDRIDALGIHPGDVWTINGAGAEYSSTTPQAVTEWITWMRGLDWGDKLPEMLPIMGVDGSLSLSEQDSPSTGMIQAKTGTYAGIDPGTLRLLMPGQALAGLMEDSNGNQYAFGLYMVNSSFENPSDGIFQSLNDVAAVAAALQQELG